MSSVCICILGESVLSASLKIVVVSPHRDDAAFSLGLSIRSWLAAGHSVSVLNCFTKSDYAPYSDVEALHANDRVSFVSALRRREDIAWQRLYKGRLAFRDLDLLDAPLRLACAVDEVLRAEIRPGDRAVARVAGAITKSLKTSGVALVAPLAVGDHIDHRVCRQAVLDAVTDLAIPLAFYEDLPYAAREGEAGGLADIAAGLSGELQPVFAGEAAKDMPSTVQRKARLAECYDSQIDSEVVQQIASFSEHYGGRERLWANAAWRESGLAAEQAPA